MSRVNRAVIWTMGMLSVSGAALADAPKPTPPQEPAGFVAGGVIGGFAAGPIGAVIGAGLGTWLGERVHRASEAKKAEAAVARLEQDNSGLKAQTAALESERNDLAETNRALTAHLEELAQQVEAAQSLANASVEEHAAAALDGLQGDVLFRTGSAELSSEMSEQIRALAGAVAKAPGLKVRVDGYADPRGTVASNLELSKSRADAVRDLFLSAGVDPAALEVNAYGKSLSQAQDPDGFALERRVRLTLETGKPVESQAAPVSAATLPGSALSSAAAGSPAEGTEKPVHQR